MAAAVAPPTAYAQRAGITAVVEARRAIEAEACALAAERRTAADLRAIGRALAARHARLGEIEGLVDADLAFHRRIVVAAHNGVLLTMFDGLTVQVRQAMIDLLRSGAVQSTPADHHAHVRMAEAVRAGDGALAAGLSRAHLTGLGDAVARLPRGD
jgi:DNA-binding FadR family transcriptional regulator